MKYFGNTYTGNGRSLMTLYAASFHMFIKRHLDESVQGWSCFAEPVVNVLSRHNYSPANKTQDSDFREGNKQQIVKKGKLLLSKRVHPGTYILKKPYYIVSKVKSIRYSIIQLNHTNCKTTKRS